MEEDIMKKITIISIVVVVAVLLFGTSAVTTAGEVVIKAATPETSSNPLKSFYVHPSAAPFTHASIEVRNDSLGKMKYMVYSMDHPFGDIYDGPMNIAGGELESMEGAISNPPFEIGRCYVVWRIPGNISREDIYYQTEIFQVKNGQRGIVYSLKPIEIVNLTRL